MKKKTNIVTILKCSAGLIYVTLFNTLYTYQLALSKELANNTLLNNFIYLIMNTATVLIITYGILKFKNNSTKEIQINGYSILSQINN